MRPFDHITLPDRKLKHNLNTEIKATTHFLERSEQRGFDPLDVAKTLLLGKVTSVKNHCLQLKFAGTSLVVRPHTWGYLLITVF